MSTAANSNRFSGFADLYDAHRPSPPAALGGLLCSYANVALPGVVDLGSGTGLSTRWAASWAASVVGVEPNADMRKQAEKRPVPNAVYRTGVSHDTGLDTGSADVVIAVQAMHWMEPVATLTEVARLLRPGGVFATMDADWPPVSGVTGAERAWAVIHRRIRVFEARLAAGLSGTALVAEIDDTDPALIDEDLTDPHRNRAMPDGVTSWSKREHLANINASGFFDLVREVVFDEPVGIADIDDPTRFVALLRSQGSYQALRRRGLSDADIGVDSFDASVRGAFRHAASRRAISFSWRVRLGVARTAHVHSPDVASGDEGHGVSA